MMLTYDTLLAQERPGVLHFGGARMALLDLEAGFWALRRQMETLVGARLTDDVLQQAGANGGASFARAFAGESTADDGAQLLRDCIAAYQAAGFGQFEIVENEWSFDKAQDNQDRPLSRVLVRGQDAFEAWAVRQHEGQADAPVCAYTAGVLVGFVNVLSGRQDVVCIERACQGQGAETCLFELLPAGAAGDASVVAFAPDPALGRQLNLLEILFDRMPMGIVILDRDLRIRRFNPTWAEFIERYTPASANQVVPGVGFFELAPGIEPGTQPVFERVLSGETVRQKAFRLDTGGLVSYWDAVISPLTERGKVIGIVHVTTDATERVQIHQELEQRVEQRTRALATLLRVSHTVNSTLELGSLLDLVLDQLQTVVEYTGASILTLHEEYLSVRAYRGPIPQEQVLVLRFPLSDAPANREVIRRQEPVIIPNVRGGTSLARLFQDAAGDELDTTFGYVRSWLGVPLMVKDQVLGMLTLDHDQPDFFTAQHANLVQTFANQVAVAIENARLFAHAEEVAVAAERNRLARDLHDAVTQTLFSSSLIAEVLPRLWERDPEEGRRRLQELRELTRGALAEMRTLLLELRPSALEEANLGDLLHQLAESITGRARVPVVLEAEGECELEAEVKVALYRIAQEALNNVAKHAGASKATVRLFCQPGQVELCVCDDGLGFDPASLPLDSLGLGIMRERVEAIDAELEIKSQIGHGTEVSVVWAGDDGR
ncbi:MAG: GAF domain-containing protein [Anaerolineae bacterium]|jgi:signal transduction histidine kinase/PAS domain-containing protein